MEIHIKNGQSIEEAFDAANKSSEAVVITIEPGDYEVPHTLLIEKDDLSVKGENGEVNLRGSKRISLADSKKDGNIITVDLKKHGITDMGKFGEGPYEDFWHVHDIPKPHMTEYGPGLELFYDGELMPIARYPEKGFMKIKKAVGKTPIYFKKKKNGTQEGMFIADDDAVKDWEDYEEIMLIGYWNADWATQRHMVKHIDRKTGVIEVSEPYHCMGYRDGECYTEEVGGRFYAINVKAAIKKPGDWCIDRKNGLLYIYPYDGQEYIDVSCADDMFYAKGHKNICIENVNVSQCRKSAVYFEDCSDVNISDMKIKNTGAWGILGENCMRMSVEKCAVSLTGGGGIGVNGGSREKLIPSENVVKKCVIHDIARWHKTYMAALDISGVGCTLSENYIYDVPHFGIVFAGNNHIIEKNEINNACYESNDAGAIYSGRNWTFRGNIIRYNYLHNLSGNGGMGCIGLYFDDAMSSAEVYGNIFADIPYIGLLLGGGRDFDIHNNTFYNCKMAIMYDRRATNWGSYQKEGYGRLGERLREIDYKCDVWKKAYPKLYTMEEDNILYPMGNVLKDNTVIGGDGFALQAEDLVDITVIEGNVFVKPEFSEEHEINHATWYYINE